MRKRVLVIAAVAIVLIAGVAVGGYHVYNYGRPFGPGPLHASQLERFGMWAHRGEMVSFGDVALHSRHNVAVTIDSIYISSGGGVDGGHFMIDDVVYGHGGYGMTPGLLPDIDGPWTQAVGATVLGGAKKHVVLVFEGHVDRGGGWINGLTIKYHVGSQHFETTTQPGGLTQICTGPFPSVKDYDWSVCDRKDTAHSTYAFSGVHE